MFAFKYQKLAGILERKEIVRYEQNQLLLTIEITILLSPEELLLQS